MSLSQGSFDKKPLSFLTKLKLGWEYFHHFLIIALRWITDNHENLQKCSASPLALWVNEHAEWTHALRQYIQFKSFTFVFSINVHSHRHTYQKCQTRLCCVCWKALWFQMQVREIQRPVVPPCGVEQHCSFFFNVLYRLAWTMRCCVAVYGVSGCNPASHKICKNNAITMTVYKVPAVNILVKVKKKYHPMYFFFLFPVCYIFKYSRWFLRQRNLTYLKSGTSQCSIV